MTFITLAQFNSIYSSNGKKGVHSLDAKISLADLASPVKDRIDSWLRKSSKEVYSGSTVHGIKSGAVFEIRQGYKSADSKRQNADLRFGIQAHQAGLLPVFLIISSQISEPVLRRYRSDGMLVLTGSKSGGGATESTFVFFSEIIAFDLAAFFKRNSEVMKNEIQRVIGALLSAEG